MMTANIATGVSVMGMLEAAFEGPIAQRCNIVEKILTEFSPKELHGVLPLLLESLFNFNNHPRGWSIHKINGSGSFSLDFRCLHSLLNPTKGPLLQVIYKLTSDSTCKYEFPVCCLPFPTQCMIEEGNIPPFYLDKIQFNPSGKAASFLLLNAFEYYMFHFAYFLVNPQISKATSRTTLQPPNALYPILAEEYLNCFFPLDGSNPPFIQLSSASPCSPFHHVALQNRFRPFQVQPSLAAGYGKMSPSNMSPMRFPGLIKVDPQLMMQQTLAMPNDHGWVEKETWMSEELLQILVEFWLNQSVSANPDQLCLHTNAVVSFSAEHVRLVRLVVKHLHFFVNTLRLPNHSPHRPQLITHWEEFKGLVWPHYVQKKLYRFLCHNFEWWPLDSSFRVVLETWLSFIQPWRYCDHQAAPKMDQDAENKDMFIEDKWRQFVSDHLLFYSVLFHSFLERAYRIDLSASKNAFMLFRVSKILCLPNLKNILLDTENMIHDPFAHSALHHSSNALMNSCYRSISSPTTNFALQFSDLEGPRFQYQPLLCHTTENMITQLLKMCGSALERARIESDLSENVSKSWLWWLGFSDDCGRDYNATRFYSTDLMDDNSSGIDCKKAVAYLEHTINNLCSFFQLDPPSYASQVSASPSKTLEQKTQLPDLETTDEGLALTPLGRYQIINGLRKFDVSYQGDPDLQPIRSYECAFLVRLFYSIAKCLNTRFASNMCLLYHRHDFIGRMAQHLLHPPQIGTSPVRMNHLSPAAKQHVQRYQQPHLSLRWLASYPTVGYLLAFFLVLRVWGNVSVVAYFTILLIIYILFLMAKAFFVQSSDLTSM